MNVVICDAIRAQRLLRFAYEGYERVIEPHIYGVNSAGNESVGGWLSGGWSKSETEPGWRNFLVEQMRDVAATAERFDGPRPGFSPEHHRMRQVYCALEPGAASDATPGSSAQ